MGVVVLTFIIGAQKWTVLGPMDELKNLLKALDSEAGVVVVDWKR